ncbi:MFS transporter [Acidaminococcus timonensis]|uniref:MFS transporter n=2 Tax=Acidaminococcus TaxID=904 RepID=UPI003076E49A
MQLCLQPAASALPGAGGHGTVGGGDLPAAGNLSAATGKGTSAVFHSASFDGAVLSLLLVQFLCLGIGFLLPNYAQLVLRMDPFSAGCILLPGCLVGAALAPVSGRLYDRLGAAKPLLVGSLCILLSLVGYNLVLGSTGISGLTLVYVIFTVGQGLSAGNILTYVMGQLPEAIQQTGSDLSAGTSLGTAHAFLLLLVLALCQGACIVRALKKRGVKK